jgi:glycosyltransferase involved in cell wall biosynthesis
LRVLEVNDVSGTAKLFIAGLQQLGHSVGFYQPTVGTYRRSLAFRALIPAIRVVQARRMRGEFIRGAYDRLHIHYETFGLMGIVASLPFDLHCHGGMVTHMNRPLSAALIRRCLSQARSVYYSTPNLYERIAAYRPDAIFIPNPVDTEFFSPGHDGSPSGRFRILSISKMDQTKGWSHIENVLMRLTEHRPRPEIYAFGFGTEPTKTRRARVERLRSCGVHVLSAVDREAMRKLIRSADLVLGQFHVGAVGLSELEALACGKPVCCYFDYEQYYPEQPPFLNSKSADKTVSTVFELMADRAKLCEVGAQGRDWVTRYHSVVSSARVLAEHLSR